MEYKDEGGEGGKKERGGLRRRADKKETRNGVNGQERDTEWGEWRLRQRRTRTRHGVNNGRGPTREAHEERRQGREL